MAQAKGDVRRLYELLEEIIEAVEEEDLFRRSRKLETVKEKFTGIGRSFRQIQRRHDNERTAGMPPDCWSPATSLAFWRAKSLRFFSLTELSAILRAGVPLFAEKFPATRMRGETAET